MASEFGIIKKFFTDKSEQKNKQTQLGIGDDGAIVSVPTGYDMVIAVDTLVAGVHFPKQTSPYDIGYKALAVNLSDLAAMGAEPASFTLALTLSEGEQKPNWLQSFANGLFDLANKVAIELIGGDTTRGPLTISIQAHGLVPKNKAMTRSGAKSGDRVFVSGTLGDAHLGLELIQGVSGTRQAFPNLRAEEKNYLLDRLNRPQARINTGLLLRDLATSCIDVSDGLLADLDHICESSQCRAIVNLDAIPLSLAYKKHYDQSAEGVLNAIASGDDYELCFTVKPEDIPRLKALNLDCPMTQIGEILPENKKLAGETQSDSSGEKVILLDKRHNIISVAKKGYTHF